LQEQLQTLYLSRYLRIQSFRKIFGLETVQIHVTIVTIDEFVSGVYLNPKCIEVTGNEVDSKIAEVKFDKNNLHGTIRRFGKEELRINAKSYNWKMHGKLVTCEDCVVRKAKENTGKQ
jgi:hypothetical protein